MRLHQSVWGISGTALALTLALGACGDDGNANTTTSGDGGSGAASTGGSDTGGSSVGGSSVGGSGAGGDGPSCEAPEPAHPGGELDSGHVTATVTDQNGDPAANVVADLCGTNLCAVFGETDASGSFDEEWSSQTVENPAFLYGTGKRYAKMSALFDMTSVQLGDIDIIRLPAFDQGSQLSPGGDFESNGVTVHVPQGASIEHDITNYTEESQRTFRAAVVEPANLTLPAMDDSLGIEVLVSTAPIDTVICPAASFTFPNPTGLSEGSTVDVYLHGSRIFGHYAPYGKWEKLTTATVTANGIETDEGIEMLGVYGLAPQ